MLETTLAALTLPSLISEDFLRAMSCDQDVVLFPIDEVSALGQSRISRAPHQIEMQSGRHTPLGRFFEKSVEHLFRAAYAGREIHTNIQLNHPQTSGELDFVISSLTQTMHVEVALKFFLYRPDREIQLCHFHGPQLQDRLDLKLDKLILQQLRRHVPREIQAPAQSGKVIRGLWLAGILYYPWTLFFLQDFPDSSAIGLNPNHQKGWWARPSDIIGTKAFSGCSFYVLPKSHWLKPMAHISAGERSIFFRPNTFLDLVVEPTYVSIIDCNGVELPRGFIVPEAW